MAGILDFLEQGDNPLGLALLAAGGPTTDPNRSGFGQRIAGAVSQAQAQRQAARERQMMEEWRASQIAENASQAELRRAQIAEAERKAALFGGFAARLGGGAGQPLADGGASAGGAPGGPGGAVPRGTGRGLADFTPDDLALAQLAGLPNLTEAYKLTQPEMKEIAPGLFRDPRKIPQGLNQEAIDAHDAAERRKALIGDRYRRVERINPVTQQKESVLVADVEGGGGPAPAAPPASRPPAIGTFGRGASGPTNPAESAMAGEVASLPPIMVQKEIAQTRASLASGTLSPQDRPQAQEWLRLLEAKAAAGIDAVPAGSPMAGPVPTPTPPLIGGRPPAAAAPAAPPMAQSGGIVTDFSPAEKLQQEANRTRTLKQIEREAEEAAAPGKSEREIRDFRRKEEIKAGLKNKGDYEKQAQQADDAIAVIDKALKHPGREAGTGLSRYGNPQNFIPGTDAYDFAVVNEQLKGKAFLAAFESLKGGGAISVAEGDKATAAIARLDRAQSEGEYKAALEDFKAILTRGKKKALELKRQAQADGGGNAPAGGQFEKLPPASQFKGKTARDTATGKRFLSDGLDWKPLE